jgi:hypothetical protein
MSGHGLHRDQYSYCDWAKRKLDLYSLLAVAAMVQKGAQAEASLSSEKEGEGQGVLRSLLPPRLYRGIAGIGGLLPKDEEQRDIPLEVCVRQTSRGKKFSPN